ncbi:helix-turn-helix domain-containing protein [Streptomyces sp. NPDC002755]|uniref:helix-turn-helix domain-containing protein n=1 Tax=Streptomyces sp. NPDC002884 TaxID=3154544 RepID=UPI00331D2D8C
MVVAVCRWLRYLQDGGLTPERQAFRERIRLEAAERFAADVSNAEVAKDLRVSVCLVQLWRRAWHHVVRRNCGPPDRSPCTSRVMPCSQYSNRNCPRGRSHTAGWTRPGRWQG